MIFRILLISLLTVAASASGLSFGVPYAAGGGINSSADEWGGCFAPDGESIYFSSNRGDSWDIYVCQLVDGEWSEATKLGANINGDSSYEGDCLISPNGEYLYYTSNRDGDWDIWRSKYNGGEWGESESITNLNKVGYRDFCPAMSSDSTTFYLSSDRPGGYGQWDIWVSELDNGEWSTPTVMEPPVNSGRKDYAPKISTDGEYVFFASNRDGRSLDLWVAEISDGVWGEPKAIPVNTGFAEYDPFPSPDGKWLYFTSDRRGSRNRDIYAVEMK